MAIKILVMGLPGSGKTYFAEQLKKYLENFSEHHAITQHGSI